MGLPIKVISQELVNVVRWLSSQDTNVDSDDRNVVLNKIHEYTCTFRKAELMSKLSVKYLDAETGD